MDQSEERLINKISNSFSDVNIESEYQSWMQIPDNWIENNVYVFEEANNVDKEIFYYLPAYMRYVLKTFRKNSQSMVYLKTLDTLSEYGKCKHELGVKYMLNNSQLKAVREFLKHLRYNQPANIDIEQLDRIIKNWKNIT
jgi:hypothetical protein